MTAALAFDENGAGAGAGGVVVPAGTKMTCACNDGSSPPLMTCACPATVTTPVVPATAGGVPATAGVSLLQRDDGDYDKGYDKGYDEGVKAGAANLRGNGWVKAPTTTTETPLPAGFIPLW